MTMRSYPVLSVMFQITTNEKALQNMRDDVRRYLARQGMDETSRAYELLTEAPRNQCISDSEILELVGIVLDETDSRGRGPMEVQDAPVAIMPILRAFHEKYVEGKEVAWGPKPTIEQDLTTEVIGRNLKW